MNTATPRVSKSKSKSKKRELTSPDFVADTKKNRLELDLDSIDPEDLPPLPELPVTVTTAMASDKTSQIVIPPEEMRKLADLLQDTFRDEIGTMVTNIVDGVLHGLQDRINTLEKQNAELKKQNTELTARVTALESQADKAEQYSRRNCLRVSGFDEKEKENTDGIILRMAADIGSDLRIQDIDRSHRVGNPNNTKRTRPRDIIVKFATYRSRNELYNLRTKLKVNGYEGIFMNEDLTKKRSKYLYEARLLLKVKSIQGAWSSDGTILIKDHSDDVHRVNSLNDLVPFGYVPNAPKTNPAPPAGPLDTSTAAPGGASPMD